MKKTGPFYDACEVERCLAEIEARTAAARRVLKTGNYSALKEHLFVCCQNAGHAHNISGSLEAEAKAKEAAA